MFESCLKDHFDCVPQYQKHNSHRQMSIENAGKYNQNPMRTKSKSYGVSNTIDRVTTGFYLHLIG